MEKRVSGLRRIGVFWRIALRTFDQKKKAGVRAPALFPVIRD